MDIEQNWQTYRSTLNDKVAVFSANLSLFEQFPHPQSGYVVQFSLPYETDDETGLPNEEEYERLTRQTFKALTQLSALPDTLYAGNIMSAGKSKLYFYTSDTEIFLTVLSQIDGVDDIETQRDAEWDLYFDFLLPSPLEMKINATEEILEMLTQNNRALSDTYVVEHRFHFDDKDNLQKFIEKVRLSDVPFNQIQYTDELVPVNDEEMMYMAKLIQEIKLDSQEIFKLVEYFEQLANQLSGEYIGWECDDLFSDKQLN